MKDFQFEFDLEGFNKLFPFYILIDHNFNIKSYGKSLCKIIPNLKENSLFTDFFLIKRPQCQQPNFSDLFTLCSQLIVLESLQKPPIILRGQFQKHKDSFLFVGSPWSISMDEVAKRNLKLKDFAIHDPLIDLLHLLKNQEISNEDLKQLILKINEQKKILIEDKVEINKLSLVASANKNGVVLTDLKGKLFWTNDAYLELTGYTKCDVIERTLLDLGVSEFTDKENLSKIVTSFKSGKTFDCEVYHKKKNGDCFWARMKGQPVLDLNDEFVQYFVIIEDITKEKQVNDQLKESKNMLSSLILNLQSGILLEDENRKILLTNKKFCKMFGIQSEPKEMVGFDCSNSAQQTKSFFKDSERFVDRIDEILKNREIVFNEELELVDGRFLERIYIPIIIEGRFKGNLWTYDDITLKKNYNESLSYEKEKYRSIIENMSIGLIEVNNDDEILLTNQRFSEMSGYSVDFLIGKKGADVFLDDESKSKLKEKEINRKDGKSDSYEISVKNQNGEIREWLISGAPNYNLNKEVIGSIGLHFDITDYKQLENQREQLLKKLEKQNEQLHDYAHIVSHDLKSPLRSIHSLITFIKEDTEVLFSEKTLRYFNLIQEKTEKMDALIHGILTYSKIENSEVTKEEIDLMDLINNIITTIFIPSNIEIVIKNNLPIVFSDKFRTQQLFQNLISNAVNYNYKPSGEVVIDFQDFENYYIFSVKDNGIGIEEENKKKLFQMFQSFDSNDNSTGIGLSIVRRIIENANEKVWFESEQNIGSIFYFTMQK
jgi:PAS domain S-box-containing protein